MNTTKTSEVAPLTIVLVGDEKVGKSSLLIRYLKDYFQKDTQVLPDVRYSLFNSVKNILKLRKQSKARSK